MVLSLDKDGPFGPSADASISVGFSDTALLVVSLCGFGLLVGTVYALVLARLKTKEEAEEDAKRELDYDEYLIQANVAALSRAELKARARALARRQQQNPDRPGIAGSRKERHKLAKDIEKEERKQYAGQRREEQLAAQEAAQGSKRERERVLAERMEMEKRKREEEQLAKERIEELERSTFLSTDTKQQSVDDWVAELENAKENVVYLNEVADEFGVSPCRARDRIQQLVDENRLWGVFEEDGRFVRVRESEVHDLLREIRIRHRDGTVSNLEIASLWNSLQTTPRLKA
jgi:DDRGK domain